MKYFVLFLIAFPFIKLSAQKYIPFDCDDFNFNIESSANTSIRFINQSDYFSSLKDTVILPQKALIKENEKLYTEFQKKFPNKISTHCIKAKTFSRGEISETSYCSQRQKIFLITKEKNFYIFKLNAFEIDDFLVFNEDNETIYFTENYPLILDEGKIIFDIGRSYPGKQIINYYQFEDKKVKYASIDLPFDYRITKYNIVKYSNYKVITELTRHQLKETSPNYFEKDKDVFCKKFMIIN